MESSDAMNSDQSNSSYLKSCLLRGRSGKSAARPVLFSADPVQTCEAIAYSRVRGTLPFKVVATSGGWMAVLMRAKHYTVKPRIFMEVESNSGAA